MLQFDHLTIVAPSLDEGIEHLRSSLDIDALNGATHVDMGTHNRRVRLGERFYLEIIAMDPAAPPPKGPRWFGLDQAKAVRSNWSEGFRLGAWGARTYDIDKVLTAHGQLLGTKRWLENAFYFSVLSDGELPMGGALPCVIDDGDAPLTSRGLIDQHVRLREFVIEHPQPAEILSLYDALRIVEPPRVTKGQRLRLSALLDTPSGLKVLS